LRIALVCLPTRQDASELTGPDAAVPALACALAGHGHEVTLITSQDRAEPRPVTAALPGVRQLATLPVVQTGGAALDIHLSDLAHHLRRELTLGEFEVVHSHGWLAGLITATAVPALVDRPAPMVQTFHQLRLSRSAGVPGRPSFDSRSHMERAIALRADHVVATHCAQRDMLLRAGVPRQHISVIPPGVHTPDTPVAAERRHQQRRVVMFGPAEHATEAVRALTALPDTELVICATPEDRVDDAGESLARLAAGLGVHDRVRITYRPTAARRAPLIVSADLALCLTTAACPGTMHLEAMALSVPVISANPLADEAVVNQITGLHASHVTACSLALTIRGLLANRTARHSMSIAGRDRALIRYPWPRIAEETLRVYRSLTDRKIVAPAITTPESELVSRPSAHESANV
jgi:glycosyltransferase involved in cell wall biosynthesis